MEIPSLQAEVNRKAVETLEWLTDSVMKKKISQEQFSTGVDALFMAASGLVSDRDFIVYITEAQSLCDPVSTGTAVELEELKPLEAW